MMELTITTIFQRKDFDELCAAVLRTSKHNWTIKVLNIICVAMAVLFWILASAAFVSFILEISSNNIGSFPRFISLLLAICFVLLGYNFYIKRSNKIQGSRAWRAYQNKEESVQYYFSEHGIFVTQACAETKYAYHGIIRLCEGKRCFFLFTTQKSALILPKRDISQQECDAFRTFIVRVTGLQMETL